MGVWIETRSIFAISLPRFVTPCMGVWIETSKTYDTVEAIMSHPVWVCGLKLKLEPLNTRTSSHTLYGCVD